MLRTSAVFRSTLSSLRTSVSVPFGVRHTTTLSGSWMQPTDQFVHRHNGIAGKDFDSMLEKVHVQSIEELIDQTVPANIRMEEPLKLGPPRGEHESLRELRAISRTNVLYRSYIGTGYSGTLTPKVILRNVVQNPAWYTPYTPYQAEISQGRMESLLNFQTVVADLTGLPAANSSLLDEGTAAAEAMGMCYALAKSKKKKFFLADDCHPQVIALCQTRAVPLGIELVVGDPAELDTSCMGYCGAIVQYPATDGSITNYEEWIAKHQANKVKIAMGTDLLALTLLKSPGELGADIAYGNSQRFGVPLGFGGPHAAFFAVKDELKRGMPGRMIGVSRDRLGKRALRMALQTREQHIRREKATSNICTAQALLANVAAMYAIYHGPQGLTDIAQRVHGLAKVLAAGVAKLGHKVVHADFFDTLSIDVGTDDDAAQHVLAAAEARGINLRKLDSQHICVALDETTESQDIIDLLEVFGSKTPDTDLLEISQSVDISFGPLERHSKFLTNEVFNSYHTETEMMRYIHRLASRDLGLQTAMIPLGSCTMKLNAANEMVPITWAEFGNIHPFVPSDQAKGYKTLTEGLETMLINITGYDAVSLQPNSGSNGEYAGLLAIRKYHISRGETNRNLCLIPISAHGTNPASCTMAGLKVVPVITDIHGNVDIADLKAKAEKHKDNLAGIMVTYPSTHGVFESSVQEICDIVHSHGGQVYLDGANLNAQVGLCQPGKYGADVSHLNLHKTFCIPHGGGGPGMGPIGVRKHLAPFLPGHPLVACGGHQSLGVVSSAPWGSGSILPISWMYIRMMGASGLKRATETAILSANYMMERLRHDYKILFRGVNGRCAHEFIVDLRPIKAACGITESDIAKRLIDYGFHAPTMSFPVAGTLMIEPTESESKYEVDRFCDAMLSIREEIRKVEDGTFDKNDNVLKMAPHTQQEVNADEWTHPYSRELAAYPVEALRRFKFWPTVSRLDDVYGDTHLHCTCAPMSDYE